MKVEKVKKNINSSFDLQAFFWWSAPRYHCLLCVWVQIFICPFYKYIFILSLYKSCA